MIKYALKCSKDHRFESWFQSYDSYDALKRAGHLSCAICGDSTVEKELMAPHVRPARKLATQPAAPAMPKDTDQPSASAAPTAAAPTRPLAVPSDQMQEALAAFKRQVEATTDYVGTYFAREARAMHEGETPSRAIWGETRPDEARALVEDGVPVMPLPFIPTRKTN